MRIVREGLIYVIAEVFSKSVPFLLLPYLTRMLGIDGYGVLSYYQAIMAFAFLVLSMSQDGAIVRYYFRYGHRSIGLAVFGGALYSFVVALVFLFYAIYVKSEILALISISSFGQALFSAQLAIRQSQKNVYQYLLLQVTYGCLSIALTIIIFELSEASVLGRVLSIMASNLICAFIAGWVWARSTTKIIFSLRHLGQGFLYVCSFGLPLILHQFSFFAKGQLDKIFIYNKFEASDLGVYAAAYQIASAFSIFLLAINKALVPHFFGGIKSGSLYYSKIRGWAWQSIILCFIAPLAFMFLPIEVYRLLLGDGFDDVKYFVVLFSFAFGLLIPYLVLVNYMFYFSRTYTISVCTILSTLVYIFFVWLFSMYDIKYIPFALILSNFFLVILIFILSKPAASN